MMVAALKHDGTMACSREVLKMSVKTSFRSSVQSFRTQPGMLSGPAALHGLMLVTLCPNDQAQSLVMGGCWGFLWVGVLCFKVCKEAVQFVEQRGACSP